MGDEFPINDPMDWMAQQLPSLFQTILFLSSCQLYFYGRHDILYYLALPYVACLLVPIHHGSGLCGLGRRFSCVGPI